MVPAGTLGEATAALSRAAGVNVRLADASLWRRPVAALHGRMRVGDALAALAAQGGLRLRRLGRASWLIEPGAAAPTLPAPPPRTPPTLAGGTILVTASKRDVPLDTFPGTVTLVDGASLVTVADQGSDALMQRVSSLSSTYFGGGRDKLFIRGIADSGLVGQSQATVGQYWGDLRLSYNGPDPDLRLYDISSVQVLEGPQGTLYGAGSLGGIIRIERAAPALDRFGGTLSLATAVTDHGAPSAAGGLALNVPLARDVIGLRAVGYGERDGGYIDALLPGGGRRKNINRQTVRGGRLMVRIAPATGWTIDLGGLAQSIRSADAQYADADLPPLTRASPTPLPGRDFYRLAEGTIAYRGETLLFSSSTGLVHQDVSERYDASADTALPLLFGQRNRIRMIANETRLARPLRDGWGWVVGVSVVHNSARVSRTLGTAGSAPAADSVLNRLTDLTGYGEASVALAPRLIVTAGGRITRSHLSGGRIDIDRDRLIGESTRSPTRMLPSASLGWSPPGWLVYARYQQGFRPGGLALSYGAGTIARRAGLIGPASPATAYSLLTEEAEPESRRFAGDTIRTMEIGLRRSDAARRRLALAVSLAYSYWRHIQADYLDSLGVPVTSNIGDGRIWSGEASATWRPLPGLSLEAAGLINRSRLIRPNLAQLRTDLLDPIALRRGEPLPNVAAYGGRLAGRYTWALRGGTRISLGALAHYVGRARLGVGPLLGGRQGGYIDSMADMRLETPQFGVTLSVRNLADAVSNRFALGSPLEVGWRPAAVTPLRPRTVRLTLDTRF
ncbi:TonB-dependent receptor [Sphingomonas morindae]|uniref:TonB-dependent receptor n=1 Tax=Sphingomonas morindae TaxID=1541170 RepID=A0ABY4XDS0_9SPHN|nr:TonB-dependent receptor [Sphingomonas morindae]USI74841.1 TonB-dependent receptor [Sphingomonas morindae]